MLLGLYRTDASALSRAADAQSEREPSARALAARAGGRAALRDGARAAAEATKSETR